MACLAGTEKVCRVVKPVPFVPTSKTVPAPSLPPPDAVPNKVLPDSARAPFGASPSKVLVNECNFSKPVPSGFTLNTEAGMPAVIPLLPGMPGVVP